MISSRRASGNALAKAPEHRRSPKPGGSARRPDLRASVLDCGAVAPLFEALLLTMGVRHFLRVARPNQKDEHRRHRRDTGKDTEGYLQGHVKIAQPAKAPVGEAAATDADQIHNPITRGAQFGTDDLAEDGHVVAIEKPPAKPEQREER